MISIRTAQADDAEALARLAGELGYPASPDQMRDRLAMLSTSDDAVLIVEEEGMVVAWMQLGVVPSLESGRFAEIRGLVVTESRRGAGIGEQLVRAAEDWTAARGLTRLRVRTNVTRMRTHRFYERCGFTLKKEQRVYEVTISRS